VCEFPKVSHMPPNSHRDLCTLATTTTQTNLTTLFTSGNRTPGSPFCTHQLVLKPHSKAACIMQAAAHGLFQLMHSSHTLFILDQRPHPPPPLKRSFITCSTSLACSYPSKDAPWTTMGCRLSQNAYFSTLVANSTCLLDINGIMMVSTHQKRILTNSQCLLNIASVGAQQQDKRFVNID